MSQGAGNGADALVAALERLGVERVFGLPGVHNLAIWASLSRSALRTVGVRHEQTAVYAADGQARVNGRLGVALTTTGPGAANALAATGEAMACGSPVLVVATDIPTTLRRPGVYRGVLHECRDQAQMFEPVVKRTFVVSEAGEIGALAEAAAALALQAPCGPVYLQIPTDLLGLVSDSRPAPVAPVEKQGRVPETGDLAAAVELLEAAERVLIWAGGGAVASGAGPALAKLAERLAAPVVETYGGRGVIGTHLCATGIPPQVPEAGELWDEADLVLAVGSDFDGMTTQNWRQPKPRQLVCVNIDRFDATKNYDADVVVEGDAAEICEQLAAAVAAVGAERLQDVAADLVSRRWAVRRGIGEDEPEAEKLLTALEQTLDPEDVVVADMCIPAYWIAAFHRFSAPRKLAYPVGWGTLGFAFPAAIGAALADAGRVVCVCGDGGFLFAAGELATIAQEQIPMTLVIVDDGAYGMLRFDQRHVGDEPFGVELQSPRFTAWADASGIASTAVEGFGTEFAAALSESLARPVPSVIVVDASLKPPPTSSLRWYRQTS